MKMRLSKQTIKLIAQDLGGGLTCYVNKETGAYKAIIDPDENYGDMEAWEEDLQEIEDNNDKYLLIEKMSSRDSFRVMEEFAEMIPNQEIKKRLYYALNRSKPFRHFKYEVDYNEEIRQQWFKFKERKYEDWVRKYLEFYALSIEK